MMATAEGLIKKDESMQTKVQVLEASADELYLRIGRLEAEVDKLKSMLTAPKIQKKAVVP